jgi:hypothetical protein
VSHSTATPSPPKVLDKKSDIYIDSQAISQAKVNVPNNLMKMQFMSLDDLQKKEEKIPWDWTKGLTNIEQLKYASERALAGDNRWARIMAIMARPPYANKDDWYQEGKFGRKFPPDISDNRLDWQKLAADRGDAQSQIDYWQSVKAISTSTKNQNVSSGELEKLQANARQYMQTAMDNGVADAYYFVSAAYRDGKMGLEQNVIKSHACLIQLERMYSTPETRQLLEYSARRLRAGELSQAIQFANDPLSCRIS